VTVRDVVAVVHAWAPPEIAWEKDNIGLQVGDASAGVRGILVTLDVTLQVIAEAKSKGCNLIVSHHPLVFRPLKTITPADPVGRCVGELVRQKIALVVAHTNLDFTLGGTSSALADALGLERQGFLTTPYALRSKVVTFVPAADAEAVARAMSDAGGGRIGDYDECSFRTEGTGTFFGGASTSPAVGRRERLEKVPETRLEMTVPRQALGRVIRALVHAHPYEEPAYDIIPLANTEEGYGMGVIGELDRPVPLRRFLVDIRKALGIAAPRYTGDPAAVIRRVAVCGGSGSELLDDAIAARADAFVTADIRYHAYRDAEGRIALIDAGHYETEFPVVRAVVERLAAAVGTRGERIAVRGTQRSTNPVRASIK
jgi:dinuclear metal center YbgI/SA1388 family protein